ENASDQFLARQDVSPLVAAAHLNGASVMLKKVKKIVCLHQNVAELGVGNAVIAFFETRPHGVSLDHLVHGKVLADVAEEIEQIQPQQPVRVVQHVALGKVEEAAH